MEQSWKRQVDLLAEKEHWSSQAEVPIEPMHVQRNVLSILVDAQKDLPEVIAHLQRLVESGGALNIVCDPLVFKALSAVTKANIALSLLLGALHKNMIRIDEVDDVVES